MAKGALPSFSGLIPINKLEKINCQGAIVGTHSSKESGDRNGKSRR